MTVTLWVLAGIGAVTVIGLIGWLADDQSQKAKKRAVERALDEYAKRYGATDHSVRDHWYVPRQTGRGRVASNDDLVALARRVDELEARQNKKTKKETA